MAIPSAINPKIMGTNIFPYTLWCYKICRNNIFFSLEEAHSSERKLGLSQKKYYFCYRENYLKQIDRELLGVVHAVEKLSNFTTGHKTIIHTDHRPLLALFQKNIMNAPPSLARLLLRVSHYDLKLSLQKRKGNVHK